MRDSYSCDVKNPSDNSLTDIKMCAWNIEGLTADKSTDDVLGEFLLGFHVLLLTETWACSMSNFCIPRCIYFNYPRYKNAS